MTNIKEALNLMGITKEIDLKQIPCEFLYSTKKACFQQDDYQAFYIIYDGDNAGILRVDINPANPQKKEYTVCLPLFEREFHSTVDDSNYIITYNLKNNSYGIYNLVLANFEIEENGAYSLIEPSQEMQDTFSLKEKNEECYSIISFSDATSLKKSKRKTKSLL